MNAVDQNLRRKRPEYPNGRRQEKNLEMRIRRGVTIKDKVTGEMIKHPGYFMGQPMTDKPSP